MIRVQVFSSFLAACVCVALLAPGSTSPSEPTWDSRESKSDLFDQQTDPSATRAVYASTARTLSKWHGTRIYHAVGKSRFISGKPSGAVLSLVSFSRISSLVATYQDGPDITVLSSVKTPNGTTMVCSTAAANYAQGDSCSVNSATSQADPTCSTVAAVGGTGNQGYCSTNLNTGGTNNGSGPSYCSASGAGTVSGQPSCSAGAGQGPGQTQPKCSTQNNPNQKDGTTTDNCSVALNGVATTNAQCSTGTYSGVAGSNSGQCSAQTGAIQGGTQTNSCSVCGDGAKGLANQCSTDGTTGTSCSAIGTPGTGTTKDFCSVTSSSFQNAVCTILLPASGMGVCSVLGGGTGGNCSVKTPTGVQGPGANNKCGNIQQ